MRALSMSMLVAAAMLVAGCGDRDKKTEAPPPRLENGRVVFSEGNPQLAALQSDVVQAGAPEKLKLTGRLVWDEERTVRLYPPFAGRVARILVKPGDVVRAGEPLALLFSPDFGQAQAEARKAQTDFALARKSLERLRDLNAAGVAARKELNSAEADYARAEVELARAEGRVKLYGASGDTVDQSFALRSPISGTVVERNINPGQELRPDVAAGSPAMFVVTDPSRLWVQLDANERDISRLKKGLHATLRTGAWPEDTFPAAVVAISDFVDPATRTVKLRGTVDNRARKLKGEMFVSAEMEGAPRAQVQVSEKAIVQANGRNYVFVEEAPGRFARVQVDVGGVRDGTAGVVSGLTQGQKVVVEGNLFLNRLYRQLSGDAAA
ncbi:MAG TPA: efflux RND transporter periplasmic adaptor subunit [Burkholderiales bacterium]|jgi:membrane fusion protein, heavy metal efflux system|nr:efflux RND transporter periplasmic adaptor subunit [Burkholderiales bacterium]